MKFDIQQQTTEYTKKHQRKKHWRGVVIGLASVVVFCTTYALILPAITMADAQCGIPEHVHTDTCYSQVTTVKEKQLICTIDTEDYHVHTQECYDEEGNLTCGQEERPQHVHTDDCYEIVEVPSGEKVLTCGMQEHTHTKACYADTTVDVETPQTWEKTMADAPLTGEWRNDLLAIAQTQIGYCESEKNYIVLEDGETARGYTRYGAWDGNPYEEWCASFVSFCLHYADVPEDKFPQNNNCGTWTETLQKKEYDLYQPAKTEMKDGRTEAYTPEAGDLVFFTWNQSETADHVGIVSEVIPAEDGEPAKIITIEGNKPDKVAYYTYELDSEDILGYGILPGQEFICGKEGHIHTEKCYGEDGELTCTLEEHVHTDICEAVEEEESQADGVIGLHKLTYTGADFKIRVSYGEDAGLPENTELQVREIKTGSAEYEEYLMKTQKTLEKESVEKVRFARFFDITFVSKGREIEPAASVAVSITYEDAIDLSDPGNSQVIHFSEKGSELLYAEAEHLQDKSTRFTHVQDSFSVVGDLVTVAADYNETDIGPKSLPVDYYVCIDGEWTCVGSTKTGWYGDYSATSWTDANRDYITVEQAVSILGKYGLQAEDTSIARKIAYQQKSQDTKLYSDTNRATIDGQAIVPLSRNTDHEGYNLYYIPSNEAEQKGVTSADSLKDGNEFFTVKVYDTAGNLLDSKCVFTGGDYSYTGNETISSWIVSYGNGTVHEISGTDISLSAITSSVVISPKQVIDSNDNMITHSVTYKVMIDGQWKTVGTSPYYYSGTVDSDARAYITSDMAAQFFGDYGFNASEKPGRNIGYSYNDIYTLFYANGTTKTDYCMDIDGGKLEEARVVHLWTSNSTDAQVFRVRDAGNGYSFITSVKDSAYHVNVYGFSTGDPSSTQLKLSTATNENSQWKVDTGSDGRTTFWSALAPDDQVIYLENNNMQDDGKLQVWHSTGSARYWYMEQQYRISNDTKTELLGDSVWKIGLTEESNGDIVCYYLPAEKEDLFFADYNDVAESKIDTDNSFWSVSVRDDTNSVYSDGELSNMVQYVAKNGETTVTVRNADGILWSVTGANEDNVKQTQSDGYTTFTIKNITQPVEVVATKTNPAFTVQYYGNINRFATSGDNPLTVIDTLGEARPTNGGSMKTKSIYLEGTGRNTNQNAGVATELYQVKTVTELTKLYTEQAFQYEESPGLEYFNKLKDNESYVLKEIWVLKAGRDASSTNRDDWAIYTYKSDTTKFTNLASEADGDTILINDGDVLRLVTDSGSGYYHNDNTFYDYNISSGQNSDGRWETGTKGINSESNYGTSLNGQRDWRSGRDIFAFGNRNCGTGMSGYLFDESYLNKYSNKNSSYGGATFEIASGLNDDGTIQYNEWIVAPKLFNDGNATGKQTYAGSSLTFDRVGDTYTLSSATLNNSNGSTSTIDQLQYFFHPSPATGCIWDGENNTLSKWQSNIFTNNFWPMDQAAYKTDALWGKYGSPGSFQGFTESNNYSWSDLAANFPASDDGNAHNWFFGMNFAIDFSLTADYEGPLEYYFFGDDDLWVFLDKELICDIGGVHSSIGEYVNLRDYLPVGSSGQHTLSFFYTERGASGSTCWMSFTLPSVAAATTARDTGSLQIEKKIANAGSSDFSENTYKFKVEFLTDQGGTALNQTFSYKTVQGEEDAYGTIKSGGTITIHPNENVTISGIPAGTYYQVTEDEESQKGYTTTVNGSEGYIASGKIETNVIKPASFVNTLLAYELPETGGPGTYMYIIAGLLLIAGAGSLLIYNQRKRRKEEHTLS